MSKYSVFIFTRNPNFAVSIRSIEMELVAGKVAILEHHCRRNWLTFTTKQVDRQTAFVQLS